MDCLKQFLNVLEKVTKDATNVKVKLSKDSIDWTYNNGVVFSQISDGFRIKINE